MGALIAPGLLAKAAAAEVIWSALVLGTNTKEPAAIPDALRPYAPKLERIFGYNELELVGQHRETIDSDEEQWLLPSNHFFLRVYSQRIAPGEYKLKLALYQDQRLLVETT